MDLLVREGGRWAVVEVKTAVRRPWSGTWEPADRLGPAQRRRLRAAARDLARACGAPVALDLAEVRLHLPAAGRRARARIDVVHSRGGQVR